MELISVQLHPFGAITDRTYELKSGAQSLSGPNEFGKSTFREAVHHALFTATNLTPARLRVIQPWFPLPQGSSAGVTLKFRSGGKQYSLAKRWGSDPQSVLICDAPVQTERDPVRVQALLTELVGHDEATYRRVFFASQDGMAETIAKLRSEGLGLVSRAAAAAAGARHVVGDVDLESLERFLLEEIAEAYGRWQREHGVPEVDHKSGQGVAENPWKRGVGAVLRSWYAWQDAERTVQKRRQYDLDLDAQISLRRTSSTTIETLQPKLKVMVEAHDTSLQREPVERRLEALQARLIEMRTALEAWRNTEAQLPHKRDRLREDSERYDRLEGELRVARQLAGAKALKAQLNEIRACQSRLKDAVDKFRECRTITTDDLKHVESLESKVHQARVKIEAQKLVASLSSSQSSTVSIQIGSGQPELIELAAGQTENLDAEGQLKINVHGVSLIVKSGMEDIDGLLSRQHSANAERIAFLDKLGCSSRQELEAAHERYTNAKIEVGRAEAAQTAALQGRLREDWDREESELADLPACRDEATIEAESKPLSTSLGNLRRDIEDHEQKLIDLATRWGDLIKLEDALLDVGVQRREDELLLGKLPSKPVGFADSASLLRDVRRLQDELGESSSKVNQANIAIAALGEPGDKDIAELKALATELEAVFHQEVSAAQSKERVLSALRSLKGDADPYKELSTRISELFCELTGGSYQAVHTTEGLPSEAVRKDSFAVPSDRLSVGAAVSLALAVRVALAESTAGDNPAPLLLDDPFVDLDESRRAHATQLLNKLGERMQVVMLTCHEHHAVQLGPTRVTVTGR